MALNQKIIENMNFRKHLTHCGRNLLKAQKNCQFLFTCPVTCSLSAKYHTRPPPLLVSVCGRPSTYRDKKCWERVWQNMSP